VVALTHDAGIEKRLGLAVSRLRAVDLGRHDRVGEVEVLGARLLPELHDVVAELAAGPVEELAPRRERRDDGGDVVGRAPHEPVGRLGPEAVDAAADLEVVRAARDQPHRADAPARGRIDGRGHVGRGGRPIVRLGDLADRLDERRVLGDVVHALAVEEDGASVAQRRDVGGAPTHRHGCFFASSGCCGGQDITGRVMTNRRAGDRVTQLE